MKKKICDLKSGTPFKYKGQVFIKDADYCWVNLITGKVDSSLTTKTLVTVCKRIRKSDIKERK